MVLTIDRRDQTDIAFSRTVPGLTVDRRDERETALVWTFPGHGTDCGISGWSRVGHSSGHRVHVHRYENGCVNRDCPRHYRKWADRQASRVIGRLAGQRFVQRGVFSLPPGYVVSTPAGLDQSFRFAYDILKFLGVRGGLVMYHNDRIPSKFNDRDDIEEGPHFHFLADRMIDPEKVLDVYEQTGVVVKGMGRPHDLNGHLRYVLSHLGVPREIIPGIRQTTIEDLNPALDGIVFTKLHTIRWFGTWCRLKKPIEEGRFCPFCGKCIPLHDWGRASWIKLNTDPPDDEWINGSESDWSLGYGFSGYNDETEERIRRFSERSTGGGF